MLRFKDTLRSAIFSFNCITYYDYRALGNSLNQPRHLQQLTIKDEYAFKSIRNLDHLLMNCNQIQHLQLLIKQCDQYVHTDTAELEQWLASSVQRIETVKSGKKKDECLYTTIRIASYYCKKFKAYKTQ
ncbi:unnamed protein product [Mucor fragilis]